MFLYFTQVCYHNRKQVDTGMYIAYFLAYPMDGCGMLTPYKILSPTAVSTVYALGSSRSACSTTVYLDPEDTYTTVDYLCNWYVPVLQII